MEETCSSETSVDFERTTRRYIPEDGNLQPENLLANWFHAGFLNYSSMEAICSSETSVETQQTTRRYIPEDRPLRKNNLFKNTFNFFRC
jgi:hypothetical protein